MSAPNAMSAFDRVLRRSLRREERFYLATMQQQRYPDETQRRRDAIWVEQRLRHVPLPDRLTVATMMQSDAIRKGREATGRPWSSFIALVDHTGVITVPREELGSSGLLLAHPQRFAPPLEPRMRYVDPYPMERSLHAAFNPLRRVRRVLPTSAGAGAGAGAGVLSVPREDLGSSSSLLPHPQRFAPPLQPQMRYVDPYPERSLHAAFNPLRRVHRVLPTSAGAGAGAGVGASAAAGAGAGGVFGVGAGGGAGFGAGARSASSSSLAAPPAPVSIRDVINRLQHWPRVTYASDEVTDMCPILQDVYAWTLGPHPDMRPVRVCTSGHVVSVAGLVGLLQSNHVLCPICRQRLTLDTMAPFATPGDFLAAKADPASGLHPGGRRHVQRAQRLQRFQQHGQERGRDGRFVSRAVSPSHAWQ